MITALLDLLQKIHKHPHLDNINALTIVSATILRKTVRDKRIVTPVKHRNEIKAKTYVHKYACNHKNSHEAPIMRRKKDK